MLGRDIGTVVLPDAPVKFYLDASTEERARRRFGAGGRRRRAALRRDPRRAASSATRWTRERQPRPCVPAEDAVIIDTDDLTLEQVFQPRSRWPLAAAP